jgi:hypothetical protein
MLSETGHHFREAAHGALLHLVGVRLLAGRTTMSFFGGFSGSGMANSSQHNAGVAGGCQIVAFFPYLVGHLRFRASDPASAAKPKLLIRAVAAFMYAPLDPRFGAV